MVVAYASLEAAGAPGGVWQTGCTASKLKGASIDTFIGYLVTSHWSTQLKAAPPIVAIRSSRSAPLPVMNESWQTTSVGDVLSVKMPVAGVNPAHPNVRFERAG